MSTEALPLSQRRRHLEFWCWLIPAIAILAPLFLAPLFRLTRNSFNIDDPSGVMKPGWTSANYVAAVTDAFYGKAFANTLLLALVVGLLCVALAYPFAHFLVRWARRSRPLLLWCVYMPLFVSVIMRVFGWMVIVADKGIVNNMLMAAGALDEPVKMMHAVPGMVIGIVHRYLPLAILPIVNAMAKTDAAVLAASTNLGASGMRTFFRVVVPLSLPGALAGFQLVFAGVLADYVLPMLMGTSSFRMLAPVIFEEATTNIAWALAAALAMVMLLVVALVLIATNLLMRRFAPWTRA